MNKRLLYIIGIGIILIILASTIIYKEAEKHNGIITVYGNVDVRQVDLGFRVFGRVTELRYEEGDWVKGGDLRRSDGKKAIYRPGRRSQSNHRLYRSVLGQ